MPFIAVSELSVAQRWLQRRRVLCDRCEQPFVYLAHGNVVGTAVGPALAPKANMLAEASRVLKHRLAVDAAKKNVGRARCPACGHVQKWMDQHSFRKSLEVGGGSGAAIGMVISFLSQNTEGVPQRSPARDLIADPLPAFLGLAAGALTGLLVGFVVAKLRARFSQQRGADLSLSRSDAEAARHEVDRRKRGVDPTVEWTVSAPTRVASSVPVLVLPMWNFETAASYLAFPEEGK